MMQASRSRSVLTLLMLAWFAAAASANHDDAEQRVRLLEQRRQIEASYQDALHACQDKFKVTDCELAAKAERRKALAPVQKQEQQLDRVAREEQVRSSRERLAVKQLTHEGKAEQAGAALPKSAASQGESRSVARDKPVPQSGAASQARQEQAASRAERLKAARQQRIDKARAHEAEVRSREADLIARGKRAAPLPVPDASAPVSSSTR